MENIRTLTIEFVTLDDGYATTQGTAYADGELLVVKHGRGDFDVLNKIAFYYTNKVINEVTR